MEYNKIAEKMIDSLWLKQAVKDCLKEVNENDLLDKVKTQAGSIVSSDDEELQVHVMVVRNKEQFIGDFDVIKYKTIKT